LEDMCIPLCSSSHAGTEFAIGYNPE